MSAGNVDCEITSDPAQLDLDAMHAFLSNSYWSAGVPRSTLERAVRNSLCFGAFVGGAQVGFARVVTDRATFAYVADVYVLEAYRGCGVAVQLMSAVMGHPDLRGLRRMLLVTRDAHGLYRKFGFSALAAPDRFMEVHNPNVYG